MRIATTPAAILTLLIALSAGGQAQRSYPGDRVTGPASSQTPPTLSPKRIAAIGDSNTEGFAVGGTGSVDTYPAKLKALLNTRPSGGYTVDNYGVGGTTCVDVGDRFDNVVTPRKYGVVILMCGTNDIRTYSETAATVFARIQAVIAKIQATGARPVVMTVLPAGASTSPSYTAGMEAQRIALNTSIRGLSGAVTVVDLEPLTSAGGNPVILSNSSDGLHLNATGNGIVAAALEPLL